MSHRVYIVSACLLGIPTRYDATHELRPQLLEPRSRGACLYIPLCPEQLGGLPTPRPRAELLEGDGRGVLAGTATVEDEHGRDVTEQFLKGAEHTLRIARLCGATCAILKDGSPSCGITYIKRCGSTVAGMGVTAALLSREGIELEPIK